jgi:mannitol/fructose-specific phosphotransferase system IIA component (Ntr-type)
MYRVAMSNPALAPELVRARVAEGSVDAVLKSVAALLAGSPGMSASEEEIMAGLTRRESLACTNIGQGVAIPHFIDHKISRPAVVALTLESPITWGADKEPVDIVFGLTGTPSEPWRHVRALAHLARICAIPGFADRLRSARDDGSLQRAFAEEASRHG